MFIIGILTVSSFHLQYSRYSGLSFIMGVRDSRPVLTRIVTNEARDLVCGKR